MSSGPRILLARSEHLGDVLLTLPAAAALREELPSARLTYLVPRGLRAAAARCPAVDEVLEVDFPPPGRPWDPQGWHRVVVRESPAFRWRFDLALLFRPNDPWSASILAGAGIPLRVGYREPDVGVFLTHDVEYRADRHAVDLALLLVREGLRLMGGGRACNVEAPRELAGLFPPDEVDRAEALTVLEPLMPAVGERPFVLHPGTGWPVKNWPPERWGRLARAIEARHGCRVLLTGVERERPLVAEVLRWSGPAAFGLVGRLSLGAFAELLRLARAVVVADSGPMHLAALVGAPLVALFGPADPARSGPRCPSGQWRLVRADLPCGPCGRLEDPPCGARRDPACMRWIEVMDVMEAVDGLLEEPRRHAAGRPSRPEAPDSSLRLSRK